jgi:2-dehydro-3-deoxyglucarate aldolase/4-hydroxy-2-oxoheptanedioate aldolase
MKANKTKQILRQGGTAVGTMVADFRSPEVAAVLASAGFDFLIIDNEHGPYDLETDHEIIRHARKCGIDAFVRVPDAQYHLIARTLDIGAEGVMVPRVEERATVEEIVAAVKYPPVGRRGYGVRSIITDREPVSMPEAIEFLNANTLIIIQIETARAVENVADLVSVPGVDVALIGPADLSVSLGVPGESEHPKMIEAIQRVVDACQKAGVAASAHLGSVEQLGFWHQRGMRCLVCSTDSGFMHAAARECASALRGIAASGR